MGLTRAFSSVDGLFSYGGSGQAVPPRGMARLGLGISYLYVSAPASAPCGERGQNIGVAGREDWTGWLPEGFRRDVRGRMSMPVMGNRTQGYYY